MKKKGELEEAASYAFVPETFALPNDYELFAEAYRRGERAAVGDDKQSTYIAKPAGKAQGRGIFLFKKLSKLNPWRDANASAGRAPKPFQRLGGHGSAVSHEWRPVVDDDDLRAALQHAIRMQPPRLLLRIERTDGT